MTGFVLLFAFMLNSQAFAFENSLLNCSVFATEEDIFASLPFMVSIHPANPPTYGTYARFGQQPTITDLQLFNQTTIPPAIFCLKNLQNLVIRSCTNTIPAEIGLLKSSLVYLEITTLNANNTTKTALNLPSEVFNLTSLVTLNISGYELKTLPDSIRQLTKLNQLCINDCNLESIPETIGQLSQLSDLRLKGNQLKSLPMAMKQLSNLFKIDVSNNPQLSSLDALQGPRIIGYLTATNCSIDHIPLNIQSIRTLDLSNNKLVSLDGIETLTAYCVNYDCGRYYFSNNQIQFIPPAIGQLELSTLSLDSNRLSMLPAELFGNKFLGTLNLKGNFFSDKKREWISALGRYANIPVSF